MKSPDIQWRFRFGVPPTSVSTTLSLLGWLDDKLDLVNRFLPFLHSPI